MGRLKHEHVKASVCVWGGRGDGKRVMTEDDRKNHCALLFVVDIGIGLVLHAIYGIRKSDKVDADWAASGTRADGRTCGRGFFEDRSRGESM